MQWRALCLAFCATLLPADGIAQPAGPSKIGVLHPGSSLRVPKHLELLRAGMREHGHVEGKGFTIEVRVAETRYERLPELAAELVRMKVDLIVTSSTPATRAAMQATKTIPIVVALAGDAVATGLIKSLAHPGGNVTGTTYFNPELAAKHFELLKEAVPRLTKLAALVNPDNQGAKGPVSAALTAAARRANVEVRWFEARRMAEVDAAVSAMNGFQAAQVLDDPVFIVNFDKIADLAVQRQLPTVGARDYALAGGMLGYGVDFDESWRRAAYFVDKILKGAKPADIPAERATKFEFVVNLKTARALGVMLPQSILVRADQVVQ